MSNWLHQNILEGDVVLLSVDILGAWRPRLARFGQALG